VRALYALVWILGGVVGVLAAWVIIQRFRYPIDGEWMTGAVRDGVERLRDGKQLYVAPTARFAPFVYTPMYFWASALVARVTSVFVACKVVSLAATGVTAWGIFRIATTLGASRYWSRVAVLLHLATYALTIQFYDLERVDAFYAAMMVVGVALLLGAESTARIALAGIVLGLAFFAKQAGVLAFVAAIVGLAVAGERRRAFVAGGAGAIAFAVLFVLLDQRTDGWFRYYCFKLPRAHGIRAARVSLFFVTDVPKAFAFAGASVAMIVPVLARLAMRMRRRAEVDAPPWREVVFASVLGAGVVGAFMFRAHAGGWENVLVAWLPLACPACAVAATRIEDQARGTKGERTTTMLLLGAVCLQLLGAMFDPNELSPNASDAAERARLVGLVRRLEERGQVIMTTTGQITRETSLHAAALYDIMRAGDHAPADFLDGLRERRYAAIFVGSPSETDCGNAMCTEMTAVLARHYFVAGRRHERERTGMTGYDARPRWVLLPRKTPLAEAPLAELIRRQEVEKGFAQMESAKTPVETEIFPVDAIEELAAREVAGLGAQSPASPASPGPPPAAP